MPGIFGDDADRELIFRIGAGGQILDIEVLQPRMGHEVLLQGFETAAAHRLVVVPPDGVFGGLVAHQEFVVGTAPGVLAGRHHKAAAIRHQGLAARHGVLIEDGSAGIPGNAIDPGESQADKFGTDAVVGRGVHDLQAPWWLTLATLWPGEMILQEKNGLKLSNHHYSAVSYIRIMLDRHHCKLVTVTRKTGISRPLPRKPADGKASSAPSLPAPNRRHLGLSR